MAYRGKLVAALLTLLILGGGGTAAAFAVDHARLQSRLLASFADELPPDARLHDYARKLAKPAFAEHCAGCHGPIGRNKAKIGVPDLGRGVWLYDFGRVSDIERTILYGIRSGHGKARNVTDMPALGVTNQLNDDEIGDTAAYVISLSRPGGDEAAIARGEGLYQGKGQCFDCHGSDAAGNIDWGTPGFNQGRWLYGGDPAAVSRSIHDGRHGRCPAWIDQLSAATIRALAVYLRDAQPARPSS